MDGLDILTLALAALVYLGTGSVVLAGAAVLLVIILVSIS